MIVRIHRGQNQIGGSIIEVSTDSARVVFDIGINLDETECVKLPAIDGLFQGEPLYDAVIISHYHSDHIGLLNYVLDGIPIFMGKQAFAVVKAASNYSNREIKNKPRIFEENETSIIIGDLTIYPYRCDHSAWDSYMFLITDGKKKILYTGDFRANGRMDYQNLLNKLPIVDALIIEGTTLTRETYKNNIEEEELENIAMSKIGDYSGPVFFMASAMNVERMVTAYDIAHRDHRLFLEDLYSAEILNSVGFHTEERNDIRVFMTGEDRQYEMLQKYASKKIGKNEISKSRFLMCVRPSMRNYLRKLNELVSFERGILFYSMWKGYQEKEDMRNFLNYMKSLGVKVHVLHTSGHADIDTIERMIKKVSPGLIIPVHTENPQWYERYDIPVELQYKKINI